jgi:glycine/D-amino acid oxidase-like deaminating enzyme
MLCLRRKPAPVRLNSEPGPLVGQNPRLASDAEISQEIGVRGEIVRLHAREVELHHMLRLLHPRFPVYIVPRAEGRLVVGATSVESEDGSTVSVRGALELF